VIKNYYDPEELNERGTFTHPHSLREEAHNVRHFLQHPMADYGGRLPKKSHKAEAESGRSRTPSRHSRSRTPSPARSDRSASPPQEPKIVHIDPARLHRNTKPTLRQRLFGRFGSNATSSSRQRDAEEGRSGSRSRYGDSDSDRDDDEGEDAYTSPNDRFRPVSSMPIPMINEPESILATSTPETELPPSSGNGLDLERTRTSRSIRFTHDTTDSTDASRGSGGLNYGNSAPGFKKTPGLGMFRTTSIQREGDDGPSVSFSEPKPQR
jgi:hypothetical protein